jgi:hypothetical protein
MASQDTALIGQHLEKGNERQEFGNVKK